jgi:hypothetical protein
MNGESFGCVGADEEDNHITAQTAVPVSC